MGSHPLCSSVSGAHRRRRRRRLIVAQYDTIPWVPAPRVLTEATCASRLPGTRPRVSCQILQLWTIPMPCSCSHCKAGAHRGHAPQQVAGFLRRGSGSLRMPDVMHASLSFTAPHVYFIPPCDTPLYIRVLILPCKTARCSPRRRAPAGCPRRGWTPPARPCAPHTPARQEPAGPVRSRWGSVSPLPPLTHVLGRLLFCSILS
jgi:hypothetical protein